MAPTTRSARLSRRAFLTAAAALAAPRLIAGSGLRFDGPFGETWLPAPARRVVSLGYTSQDPLLALGIVPLAIRNWYGDQPSATWRWARPLLQGATPPVITGEVSMERVAALAPDLIVGIGAGLSEPEVQLLTRIAPVLMQGADQPAFGSAWQDDTRRIGRATGREARAENAIADVEARFAAARARHPEWKGMTAAAAWHEGGQTGAFMGGDNRARFLSELGFRPTEALTRIAARDGFYTTLSPEDLSPLDADLVVWISAYESAPDMVRLPMRRTLAAHRTGREVFAGELIAGALSFGSVLSLPFALDALEADIAAATDGDPATVVSSAQSAGLTE